LSKIAAQRIIARVITIKLDLTDGMRRELEARVRDGAYASVEDYVRDLVVTDLSDDEDGWEITPELAAALAKGEASEFLPYGTEAIWAEALKRFRSH
jgi:Arc/MetJ-type ribon-helix-helix transcriptional regulator